MSTAFISHPDCLLHNMGEHHPESPQRLQAIEDALKEANIFDYLNLYEAPVVTQEQLELVHDKSYIEYLQNNLPEQELFRLDADTAMNPHSLDAAYRAAGAVVLAVDLVLAGQHDNAFCNVRPPGHHAESDRAMGFCIFNNIAVGAAYALTHKEINRVAIFDFDVHQGNGTEHIFKGHKDVIIFSSFQDPFYPHKEYCKDCPNIINIPLPAGCSSKEFREKLSELCFPKALAFAPDMIFISAGFDAHLSDSMSQINLIEDDYKWLTKRIMDVAKKTSHQRIISTLEGGYDLYSLGQSAAVHIRTLMQI